MKLPTKTPIYRLIADIFRTLAWTWRPVFIFELLYKTATLFIFIPAISFIFHRVLRLGGYAGATNYELLRFVFSRYGFLCMLILVPVATVLIFLEFAVLVVLSYNGHHKRKVKLVPAFLQSLAYLPSLFKYGFLGWALYLLLLVPLINGFGSSLLPSLDIPAFISGELFKTGKGTLLYLSALAIIGYLNIRWTFLLHVIVIEGIDKFHVAAKRSAAILKKSFWKMSAVILCVFVLFVVMVVLLTAILLAAALLVYAMLPGQADWSEVAEALVIKGVIVALYLSTLFVTPLYMTTLTRLYAAKADPQLAVLSLPEPHDALTFRSQGLLSKHKGKLIALGAITAIATALVLIPTVGNVRPEGAKPMVMAHRGYIAKGAENTLEAVQGAIAAKADFAEIDVLETKDGQLAVIHDSNLKRLAGIDADVYDLTMDELRNLTIEQGDFRGKISSLTDFINAARGKIKLNIELKTHGHERRLVDKFIQTIRETNFIDECIVQSLDYDIVQQVRAKEPRLHVGYIVFAGIPELERIQADFVVMEQYWVNESVVTEAKRNGRPLFVWTVNETADMEKYFGMGVDGIITDEPEEAGRIAKEMQAGELFGTFDIKW